MGILEFLRSDENALTAPPPPPLPDDLERLADEARAALERFEEEAGAPLRLRCSTPLAGGRSFYLVTARTGRPGEITPEELVGIYATQRRLGARMAELVPLNEPARPA